MIIAARLTTLKLTSDLSKLASLAFYLTRSQLSWGVGQRGRHRGGVLDLVLDFLDNLADVIRAAVGR